MNALISVSDKTGIVELAQALHGLGHAAADRWLAAHRADIGVRSSLDLAGTFLAPRMAPGAVVQAGQGG